MTTPKDGTTKKRKGVKARRMYACRHSDWHVTEMRDFFSAEDPETIYRVAVLDVSDEAALIEQAAQTFCSDILGDIDPIVAQIYKRVASNILVSLGIIKKARK